MYTALCAGAIGVSTSNLEAAIAAAKTGGFGGVEIGAAETADLVEKQGAAAVRAMFDDAGLKPAGFGLPVDWRGTEESWRKGLEALPRQAKAAAAIGCTRTMTWIMPCSDELAYDDNRRFHVERFTPIAAILHEHGCSLGLEFIGPKTMWTSQKHPFIHTMKEMLAMGADIGPNVGLLLDCWHWYTSGSTVEELKALHERQVVYVHVNDAPAGIPLDEQMDGVRCLPGETGVIDIAGFLQALQSIGYDGPITPEPFKKELSDLPSDEARLKKVGAAAAEIFRQAGV